MTTITSMTGLRLGEECIPPEEAAAIAGIAAVQAQISRHQGPQLRGQHPKAHGCVEATFTTLADLPAELRVGVFAEPRQWPALVRFSNGATPDDRKPDVHGMAIKLIGVAGTRAVEGDQGDDQDFTLIDSETFFADSAARMFALMSARASGNAGLEAFASQDPANLETVERLQRSLRKDIASPLSIPYWSTVPYRCGTVAVKYAVTPAPGNDSVTTPSNSPDYLREAMVEHLTRQSRSAAFDFFVQVQTDPVTMPIEDPTVVWNSPLIKIATLDIPAQEFATPDRNRRCEDSAFTPWHALDVHHPLGGINRARQPVYAAGADLRHAAQG